MVRTARAEKTTAIRRVAGREINVSRHHGGPIDGNPETPVHYSTIVLRGLTGALN